MRWSEETSALFSGTQLGLSGGEQQMFRSAQEEKCRRSLVQAEADSVSLSGTKNRCSAHSSWFAWQDVLCHLYSCTEASQRASDGLRKDPLNVKLRGCSRWAGK